MRYHAVLHNRTCCDSAAASAGGKKMERFSPLHPDFGGSLCLEMFGLSRLTGVLNYIAVAVVGILLRFTPGIVMGYFVVTTTTVSEFVAAMERIHLPKQITIPMSVMFRFFPTVAEEWSAIGDAMRMRGVRFGGGKAGTILEYRMVP